MKDELLHAPSGSRLAASATQRVVALAPGEPGDGGEGDHRRVVARVDERHEAQRHAALCRPLREPPAQQPVRRRAAGDRELRERLPAMEPGEAVEDLADRGVPEAGGEVEQRLRNRVEGGCGLPR